MLVAIEVADSSLTHDLIRKARLYARAGVPMVWVVDLNDRVVHVLTEPATDGYGVATRHEATASLVVDEVALEIEVADILPD